MDNRVSLKPPGPRAQANSSAFPISANSLPHLLRIKWLSIWELVGLGTLVCRGSFSWRQCQLSWICTRRYPCQMPSSFPQKKALGCPGCQQGWELLLVVCHSDFYVEKEVILLGRNRCLCPASHGVPITSLGRLNLTEPQNFFQSLTAVHESIHKATEKQPRLTWHGWAGGAGTLKAFQP